MFDYVHALLTTRRVPEATFRAALDWLGVRGVTDLTATVGYLLHAGVYAGRLRDGASRGRAAAPGVTRGAGLT